MLKKICVLVMMIYLFTFSGCAPQQDVNINKNVDKDTGVTTLTLATNESNYYIQDAISAFYEKYPEIRIELKFYMDGIEDYINTLNVELMTGNGSDLISAADLPNTRYISGGAYANLSEMISSDSDFDLNRYNTNIFDSFKYKGNMYVMPVSVFIEAIAVDRSILDEENISIDDTKWTWEEFLDICRKVTRDTNGDGTPERYALPSDGIGIIMDDISIGTATPFIDRENKKAYLDSPDFINALELIKQYAYSNVLCSDDQNNDLFELYDRNTIVFIPRTILTHGNLGLFSENTVFLQPPSFNGVSKPVYRPWLSFAINEKSKHKEEAWKFVKFMVSDKTQEFRSMNGFAVNKEADSKRREIEAGSYKGEVHYTGGRRIIPLTESMLGDIDRLKSNTGYMFDYDDQLANIIYTESRNFFAGEKSAEETAKALQNKMELYFNE